LIREFDTALLLAWMKPSDRGVRFAAMVARPACAQRAEIWPNPRLEVAMEASSCCEKKVKNS